MPVEHTEHRTPAVVPAYRHDVLERMTVDIHICLLYTSKGYTEGTIVGNYGNTIVVRLESGKEISEYRDEVIIHCLLYTS